MSTLLYVGDIVINTLLHCWKISLANYTSIAEQFTPHRQFIVIREFGNSNINDTYQVSTDSTEENHVLESINLQHALVQFKLTESIESYEVYLRNIIQGMVSRPV